MAQREPDSESVTKSGGFLAGVKAGMTSIFQIVLFGTFVSIGALAHDLGFSAPWVVLSTVLVWAGPAQVILISSLGNGGAPIAVAIAVGLSGIRLLPMVVSLLPILRSGRRQTLGLLLAAHFTAVSMWLESLRLCPSRPSEERLAFANGIGTIFLATSVIATFFGHVLAANLPKDVVAALLFLTPISFLTSLTRNSRHLADRIAFVSGLLLGPLLAFYDVGLDLLWTGLIGGTFGYLVHLWWERRR